ncbi:MAG: PAS domain S-box protein [Nitrospinota bacterium]|nr:PAS domain S-box protein [Nitrospinota bacterium]
MTRRYILALGIIALLAVLMSFFLNRVITSQQTTAAVINISGGQRMLSQRIIYYSVMLVNSKAGAEREEYRVELKRMINKMKAAHYGLLNGDKELGLPGNPSQRVRDIYFAPPLMLDRQVMEFTTHAMDLAESPDGEMAPENFHFYHVNKEAPTRLLKSLDEAVKAYQEESESEIEKLHTAVDSIVGIIIFALVLIGRFMFRPMVKSVEEETEKLMLAEERTRLIVKSIGEGIVTIDSNRTILFVNEELCRNFGYEEHELLGEDMEILFCQDPKLNNDDEELIKSVLNISRENMHKWVALTGRRKNGTCFDIEIRIEETKMRMGGSTYFTAAIRDITERVKSESTQRKLKNAIEKMGEMVLITDSEGIIEYVNPAFERITGYSRDEVLGKNPRILKSGTHPATFYKDLWATVKSGKIWKNELVNKRKSGELYHEEMTISPIMDNRNRVMNFVANKRDITNRKKAENALKQTAEYVKLMHDITITCNEYFTVNEAMKVFLDKICEYTGWPVGHVFFPNAEGKLVSSGVWHMNNPAEFDYLRKISEALVFEPGFGIPGRVLETRELEWVEDLSVADEKYPRGHQANIENIKLGVKGAFAFPVIEGDRVVAVLEFFSRETKKPDPLLLEVIANLAYQLGRVTERKRIEEELGNYTNKLEKALYRAEDVLNSLAKRPSLMPYFEVSPMYLYRRTIGGGDNLRWVMFPSRYAGLFLHDVSGHDIEETLLNILTTAIVDDHKVNRKRNAVSEPSMLLNSMNEHLLRYCEGTSHFVTAVYLLMDYENRQVKFSLAGHPKPWLIDADGSSRQIGENAYFLGQLKVSQNADGRFKDVTVNLKPGQTILLCSDGLMEQKNDEGIMFSEIFVSSILKNLSGKSPTEAWRYIKDEFQSHAGGVSVEDDVSFIVIGARPEESYRKSSFMPGKVLLEIIRKSVLSQKILVLDDADKLHLTKKKLPHGKAKVINDISESYKHIIEELFAEEWPKQKINHISMAVSEMVMNAILHGNLCQENYEIDISYILNGELLEICVSDEGLGFDGNKVAQSIREEDVLQPHGRGLHMVELFAEEMYFSQSGNKCWAIFRKEGKSLGAEIQGNVIF